MKKGSEAQVSILHLVPCRKGESIFKNIDKSFIVTCPLASLTDNQRIEILSVNMQSSVGQDDVKKNDVIILSTGAVSSCAI